ncbi:hypothetical protein LCGC14_1229510 [marine sediment metagenome]|uniref:Uncharacterized protein n=1 Tax=marine sediment metagenome TaxID=412755 RepID=A0A0F9NR99_9ZZZZ
MTLLIEGLNRIRDLIYDDIDKGQLGTGGTLSLESNTGLETADATTLLAVSNKSKADKTIKIDYTLLSTGGTTTTYKEFELQESATPTNYDRIVFTGISFTNNGAEDLIISKKYFIKSV